MESSDDLFHLKGEDAQAVALRRDGGLVVQAGAIARKEISAASVAYVERLRGRLRSQGVLVDEGVRLRFAKEFFFKAPSPAAAAILGRSANGWDEWKRADGTTLNRATRLAHFDDIPPLDEATRTLLQEHRQLLVDEGKLLTAADRDVQYGLFRERFGPKFLSDLDGEALLHLMRESGTRDSLVYWLEFKNDEEFQTRRFGSIAGGSALKFRLFRRKETGQWQAPAARGNRPRDVSLEEAIEIARAHRDQLLGGCDLLEELPENGTDHDYERLQEEMDELAPDVSPLAWGHKYFSLLFPDKLDDYHVEELQRFRLLKLLQLPPESEGRYACAGRFVAAAREVGVRLRDLCTVLNSLQGERHRYWRIGTRSGATNTSYWPMMQEHGCAAIGTAIAGDLSWVDGTSDARERLKSLLQEALPGAAGAIGAKASQIVQFVAKMAEGDVVVAADGSNVLGVGRVAGEYEHHGEFDFAHWRAVQWLDLEPWKLPVREALRTTIRELHHSPVNLLAIERHLQGATAGTEPAAQAAAKIAAKEGTTLPPIEQRIQQILLRKGQVILFGPPGTGKTYWAERTARDLAALSAHGQLYETLDETQRAAVDGSGEVAGLVRICCFHPAYGYEDFLEGYRPTTTDGRMSYELRDGVFKHLCRDATADSQRNYYLVVDEINRGDIPRIFGELLTTLEKDKRGKRILLPLSRQVFSVPPNVFLIGTMNTADRSISLLDAALRRRFGFVELMPDGAVLRDAMVGAIPLRAWFEALNRRIREHVGRDARNLQIGHSYLMHAGAPLKDLATLKRALRDDVVPLLEEYCYEDFAALANILGDQLVDAANQRIRHERFVEAQEDALVEALLAPFPEIGVSNEALSTAAAQEDAESDDDLDDEEAVDEEADDEDEGAKG